MYLNGKVYKGIAISATNPGVDTIYTVGLLEAVVSFRNSIAMAQFDAAKSLSALPVPVLQVNPHESPDYMRALDETEWLRINIGFAEWMRVLSDLSGHSTLFQVWNLVCSDRTYVCESELKWTQSLEEHLIHDIDISVMKNSSSLLTDLIDLDPMDPEMTESWTLTSIVRTTRLFITFLAHCFQNAKLYQRCINICDCFQSPELMKHHIAIIPWAFPMHILAKAYPNAMLVIRPEYDHLTNTYRSPDRYVVSAISDDTPNAKMPRWRFPMTNNALAELKLSSATVDVDVDGKTVEFPNVSSLRQFVVDMCQDNSKYRPTEWGEKTFTERVIAKDDGLTLEQIEYLSLFQKTHYGAAIDLVEELQAPAAVDDTDHCVGADPGNFMEDPN